LAKDGDSNAFSLVGAEFLFILLPFVVSGIVFSYRGEFSRLLYMPEWSLAASVLVGQALVKFISGMLANSGKYTVHWERIALAISFLIVLCLVPSLIILSLVLSADAPSRGLAIAQLVMFVIGVGVFFVFGGGGEALMRDEENPQEKAEKN
jgi:ABC-type polysaccharide transport system permease subunit